jgi:hypothetical protein
MNWKWTPAMEGSVAFFANNHEAQWPGLRVDDAAVPKPDFETKSRNGLNLTIETQCQRMEEKICEDASPVVSKVEHLVHRI